LTDGDRRVDTVGVVAKVHAVGVVGGFSTAQRFVRRSAAKNHTLHYTAFGASAIAVEESFMRLRSFR
jgi:hypothetical protein